MSILFWSLLLVIAIYDLRENRIPNNCLLLLIVIYIAQYAYQPVPLSTVGLNVLASFAMFFSCMVLFFLRAMSPGDVKLLGVLGYWIGWGNLLSASYYILISAGIIGLIVIFQDVISNTSKYRNLILLLDKEGRKQFVTKDNLRMPFAPSVFVGLAMYQYFTI
ncbi:prepilin peptidase [Vibrio sp. JC009]|uniref:A24 family peptidase n=1 Tax=Vibrio sp. JC009 TaxID=2912314 RepID=UPI0023B1888E|nr:prepilin peptidase [Vibrio sp. JC009]WED21279.1 prepilin peptidase [Vibrio sp. JC009]